MIIFLAHSLILGQYKYEEKLSLPWGDRDMQVGLRDAPGGRYGPTAFSVNEDKVYVLDKENNALKVFSGDLLNKVERIPDIRADKFEILANGEISYTTYTYNVQKQHSAGIETRLVNRGHGEVIEHGEAIFQITESNMGYLSCVGTLNDQYYYILREIIVQDIPLTVDRDVVLYDREGNEISKFIFPVHSHTYIPEEFYVDEGNLYKMISTTDGIYIIGWILEGEVPNEPKTYSLPHKFNVEYHYNNHILDEPSIPRISEESKNSRNPLDYPPVTPSEALTTAYQYSYYEWTATAANITGGLIQDPDGIYIETPDWITPGTNYHIPYKWGGFNTLSGYAGGMQSGLYAGDKETSGVSSYTRGADC